MRLAVTLEQVGQKHRLLVAVATLEVAVDRYLD